MSRSPMQVQSDALRTGTGECLDDDPAGLKTGCGGGSPVAPLLAPPWRPLWRPITALRCGSIGTRLATHLAERLAGTEELYRQLMLRAPDLESYLGKGAWRSVLRATTVRRTTSCRLIQPASAAAIPTNCVIRSPAPRAIRLLRQPQRGEALEGCSEAGTHGWEAPRLPRS